jgi:sugar O-acyltransferase (sialic acid O-acetyltransferase NeuD family)
LKGERIIIVGTGETAAFALEYFRHDTPHEVIAFSADAAFVTTGTYCNLPVVPLEELAGRYSAAEHRAFVAAAFTQLNRVRRHLYQTVKAAGFGCVSYLSSHAAVMPDVKIGENSFVQEHAVLQHGARVGSNVFLGSGTCLGARSVVEDDCYLGAHVTIGDGGRVGRASFLSTSSCITAGGSVAEDCIIGAGAVIVKDTAARRVYLGNPARPVGRDSFETFGVIGD